MMREAQFIERNRKRWEAVRRTPPHSADELSAHYTALLDDLAYARTFYPASRTTTYLNALTSRLYLQIYRHQRSDEPLLIRFWRTVLPLALYRQRVALRIALAVFLVFFAVGFFSSAQDAGFVRGVLGDDYVDMTEANIASGNPFGVYGQEHPLYMFIRILFNNLIVAFTYFFRGILLGLPSLAALSKEAVRIGAFEQLFFARGLGFQSVTTVLIHGLLELTGIIISCGAGLVLGASILFPGSASRWSAVRRGAKDGVIIIAGLVPVFLLAALLEGYLTRHYRMPVPLLLTILGAIALFITVYFIIYPVRLGRAAKERA